MESVDTLINARWVIPVEPDDAVLEHYSVAVGGGRIRAVKPTREARTEFATARMVELDDHALIPGLVNTHTHAAMALMRGLADDLPLMQWLEDHIWPAEAKHASPEFVAEGVCLAAAEMIRSGTTCFNDMYFFPDVAAQAASAAGLRACTGLIVIDFPTAWARNADEYLSKGLAVHERYRDDPLITTAFAPHAPYTVSDAPLKRLATLAEELDVPVHMHVHETAFEVAHAERQNGERPLARLDRLGLLSPRLLAVHMTQLTAAEIERVAQAGVNVVHCPESNLKLASGTCPVTRLAAAGVNMALGTDGAASNNDLDMLGEMRTAALIAKGTAADPAALPAHQALSMATLGGARALGLDNEIGSITCGKWADLVAVKLNEIETQPLYHPVSQIVYSASRHQISDVWVAGRRLLERRRLTTLDEEALRSSAGLWRDRIAEDPPLEA